MPKIGMVCYFDPDTYPGVYNSCNILAEQGWEVDVICIDQYGFCGKSFDPRVQLHRIDKPLPSRKMGGFLQFLWFLWKTNEISRARNWDLTIGHNMHGFVAARLCRTTHPIKIIFWSQDLSNPYFINPGYRLIYILKKRFLRYCRLIIAPSYMRAEALKKYFVLSADPYVVYNSPRLVVTGPEECWRIRLGIRGDIPMVVYVGGLGKDRYVPELIESVKFWQKPSVLVVAGYGRPGVLEELRAIVRQNSTSDQVFFVGHLPSILGLVQEAQLGVSFFSSDKRMLNREFSGMASNKIFEYLALGKPAVVSHNRETEEFMEKWQCGSCLNDCSPQGIAEAIKPFLIDNNLIKRAAQNAMIAHQYETHFEKRFNVLLEKFERII